MKSGGFGDCVGSDFSQKYMDSVFGATMKRGCIVCVLSRCTHAILDAFSPQKDMVPLRECFAFFLSLCAYDISRGFNSLSSAFSYL